MHPNTLTEGETLMGSFKEKNIFGFSSKSQLPFPLSGLDLKFQPLNDQRAEGENY
jgi:hypothetical protein